MQEKRQTSPRTSISHFSSRVKCPKPSGSVGATVSTQTFRAYADQFVDVSDIESLPTHVAHAALQDGVRLVGDQEEITAYKQRVDAEYDAGASERDQERREFIDRLARGDV